MKRILFVARTVVAALREIFDEAAYARFLKRASVVSSTEAYAAFRREFATTPQEFRKCGDSMKLVLQFR